MRSIGHRIGITLAASVAFTAVAGAACAQEPPERRYQIEAQPLGSALRDLAEASGREVIAPTDLVAGKRAGRVAGTYRAEEAIALLLAGTGLRADEVEGAFIIGLAGRSADAEGAALGSELIVVTGSRIRGAAPVGASLVVIDREKIERSGYATTQQIVQSLPQNFGGGPNESTVGVSNRDNAGLNQAFGSGVNLRGLGASSTLVLLNGIRPPLGGFSGVFSDLSLVPASAIERIEVLAAGASALYGSDAVAGVVNIIPRTEFEGAETTFRLATADGDREELLASQLLGARWPGGGAMIAYEFAFSGRLAADDRDFATEDLRRFGGPDYRAAYASPGTIIAGGRSFAIPSGQDGVDLAASQLAPDVINRENQWRGTDLLPEQRRHAAYGRIEQQLGPALTVYAEALFADRRYDKRTLPAISNAPRTVTSVNPFYVDPLGTGQPISVQYSFLRDLGPETARGHVRAYGGSAGARIDLGSWSADLNITYGRQSERARRDNVVNSARLAAALADPNPATSYNLFGDGPSTNPATIDAIRGSTSNRGRYQLWSAAAKADGPLVRLPAGSLRLAVGGEYREERFRSFPDIVDTASLAPTLVAVNDLPGKRTITAGYGELLVPIIAPEMQIPLIRRLDASAAGRIESYSDFGRTTNPKLGLRWEVARGAALRASYGTSFRAPGFNDLRQGPLVTLYFAIPLPDPTAPGGTRNALVLRGNDPDVGPERATTWTAGVDLEPSIAPGLRLTATWFDIRYRDRIGAPSADLFSFLTDRDRFAGIINAAPTPEAIAAFYAGPAFINPFGVPASNVTAIIDARTQNLSVVEQSGVDLGLGYVFQAAGGRANVDLAATWLFELKEALTPTAPAAETLDTLGRPIDLRVRGGAGWTRDGWTIAAHVNHVDDYLNRTIAEPERVGSWTTIDLLLAHEFAARRSVFAGLKIAFSASNIFDADPPYAENFFGTSAVGYDPNNASPIGRTVALQVTKKW